MNSEQRDQQTYAIIGAAMEVHRQLGHGFPEAVYGEALKVEFAMRYVPFEFEVYLPIWYRGQKLECRYRAEFVCFDAAVVEIKALSKLSGVERTQLINYLKATGIRRGLLLNFGAESL